MAADERSAAAHSLMAAPVDDTLLLAYPDIYDVSQAEAAWGTEQGGKVGLLQQDRTQPCLHAAGKHFALCELGSVWLCISGCTAGLQVQ